MQCLTSDLDISKRLMTRDGFDITVERFGAFLTYKREDTKIFVNKCGHFSMDHNDSNKDIIYFKCKNIIRDSIFKYPIVTRLGVKVLITKEEDGKIYYVPENTNVLNVVKSCGHYKKSCEDSPFDLIYVSKTDTIEPSPWFEQKASAYLNTQNIDMVNHPPHYMALPAKCKNCDEQIECHNVTQHMNFNLGNAIKYIWRAPYKGNLVQDLKKAIWYLESEIEKC